MIILPSTISASAPVSEASTLDCEQWSKDAEQSLMWRSKPSLSRTWLRRWKRVGWIQLLCSRTCTSSHGMIFMGVWTSSLAGSRASRSATQESVMAWKIRDTYGRPLLEDSTLFDRPASSLKTSMESHQPSHLGITQFSTMSSATWKKWVTEQRQECSLHRKWAHHTCVSDGLSSVSWRTPAANPSGISVERLEGDIGHRMYDKETGRLAQVGLDQQVRWSTPRATSINETQESAQERMARLQQEGRQTGGTRSLQNDVQKNWPTPTGIHADRGNHDEPVENYQKRVTDYEEGRSKGKPGKSLGVAAGLTDQDNPNTNGNSPGLLNPAWVEQLMGFPSGWTDSVRSATLFYQQ